LRVFNRVPRFSNSGTAKTIYVDCAGLGRATGQRLPTRHKSLRSSRYRSRRRRTPCGSSTRPGRTRCRKGTGRPSADRRQSSPSILRTDESLYSSCQASGGPHRRTARSYRKRSRRSASTVHLARNRSRRCSCRPHRRGSARSSMLRGDRRKVPRRNRSRRSTRRRNSPAIRGRGPHCSGRWAQPCNRSLAHTGQQIRMHERRRRHKPPWSRTRR
jgi:hypothetical protein